MPNDEHKRQEEEHKRQQMEADRYERLQIASERQLENVTKAYKEHSELIKLGVICLAGLLAVIAAIWAWSFYSNMHEMRTEAREAVSEYVTNAQKRVDSSLESLTNKLDAEVQARFKADNIDNLIQQQISQRIKNLTDRLISDGIHRDIDPKLTEIQTKEEKFNTTVGISMTNLTQANDLAFTVLQAGLDDREAFDKLVQLRETGPNAYKPFVNETVNYIVRKYEYPDILTLGNYKINWSALNLSETNLTIGVCESLLPRVDPPTAKVLLNFIAQEPRFSREDKLSLYLGLLLETSSIEIKSAVSFIVDGEMHTNLNILGAPIILRWLTNEYYNVVISNCTAVLATNTTNAAIFGRRGDANQVLKNYLAASNDYENAIRLSPTNADLLNREAWLLATCPIEAIRNGIKAYLLATNACTLSGWTNWYCIGTLAAACAEKGDFASATKYQKRSIGISGGTVEQKQTALSYLRLYETNKPVRDE